MAGGATAWGAALLVLLTAGAVQFVTGQWPAAVAAALVLALAGWRFYVPVSYELNAMGVTQEILGRRRRVAWTAIDRVEVLRRGIVLEIENAGRGGSREVYIPWEDRRDDVLAHLRYYLSRIID